MLAEITIASIRKNNTIFPFAPFSASFNAAAKAAPEEEPAKMPSFAANILDPLKAHHFQP